MMIKKTICLSLGALLLSSCSINRLAVNGASDLLYKASNSVETQSNLDMVRLSLPANLTLIEGLLSEANRNEEILATLTKGYVGYAFAINESDFMIDEWENRKTEYSKIEAIRNYSKGLNFGVRYLKEKNIDWSDLVSHTNESSYLLHTFDKNLTNKKIDLETLLFMGQSLASMINLQKDNIALVAQLPLAKSIFDWVCMKDPSINYGTCDIFYGSYEAGRPKMLGGNPEKGKEIFLKAIEKHQYNWLIRMSYIQYYLVPSQDEEGFNQQMEQMKKVYDEFNNSLIYHTENVNYDWNREEHLKFYQSLAIKRYEMFSKYKKQLF